MDWLLISMPRWHLPSRKPICHALEDGDDEEFDSEEFDSVVK